MYRLFLSYPVLADEHGEISQFREDLERELRLATGDRDLQIFQDKQAIGIGEDWAGRLEQALEQLGFLIPLIQPAYLTSEWCRREIEQFHQRCTAKGLTRRILPILWRKTPDLETDPSLAAQLLRQLQRVDFSTLRRLERSDPRRRQQLEDLAEEMAPLLKAASRGAPRPPDPPPVKPPVGIDRKQIVELLVSLFSASELRRFFLYLPEGERLVGHLPERGSWMELAAEGVDILIRDGGIDASFEAALLRERPRRADEIRQVLRKAGLP